MSIGIVVGGNYSKYNNSYNQFKKENNFVLRKKIGILHEVYNPDAIFSIEYGLLLDLKGNKSTFKEFIDTEVTHYTKLNYLTIPILIKKSFGEYNNRIIISMGAYYSKMINYREINKPKHPYFDDYKSALFKKEGYYKSGDFGISAGIGKQFNNIQINFNYYKSIRNIHVINIYNHDVIKPVSLELSLKLMM